MQATFPSTQPDIPPSSPGYTLARGVAWFFLPLLLTLLLAAGIAYLGLSNYAAQHEGRIYTGVSIVGVDVGGLTRQEALNRLTAQLDSTAGRTLTFVDPATGQEWVKNFQELGVSYDLQEALDRALVVGRQGDQIAQWRQQLQTWYYGQAITPAVVVDESAYPQVIEELAAAVDRPPTNAALLVRGSEIDTAPGEPGRYLDRADLFQRLSQPIYALQNARLELLVHEVTPQIANNEATAAAIRQIISAPVTFYFEQPIDGVDMQRLVLPAERLVEWLQVSFVQNSDGAAQEHISLDENLARQWLTAFAPTIAREPQNARFYFDDYTRELVLVAPHVNGRYLNVDATLERLMAQVTTPNRSVPLVVQEVVPAVHANATAEELGIVELVSQATTWFYGSPLERMQNIARASAQFYGIVIAPGETFSFNRYLGEVSEEMGYERGLIIANGRTIEGIGGGVCQVSTTVFQAAFWGGYDIGERYQHGYRVAYYENDYEGKGGPGMDATIYSPIVDFTFTNNTEHYLLIENYFNEVEESLTFKFYSTNIGRRVERTVSIVNETPPRPDVYEYNPSLPPGTVNQVDWAAPGADVTVHRIVYNRWGEVRDEDYFISQYIPWANVYEVGPEAAVAVDNSGN